jgi:hypothetical protein
MKVMAKNEALRKALKHPTAGILPKDGSWADWPEDTFTYRLVRDGDLLTEEQPATKPAEEK